ncbi:MAG TPA: radical SAM protein [Syntrophales bacterium]|nr:radical SAM protein [Syntrophales bacterium]HOX94532.1 radical SAM protein [Syntrophales bacterium]HPI58194.1 radical SAM protein [Syntrophales bacterium]HPN26032.1 radical SAM protein [Syntrophales bacterium]HQM30315.1 radical SAM protein [Syntrophales bacterium]
MKKQCVFGPILSRRLGKSLGVDVFPEKICNYDCIYCELGRSTKRGPEAGDCLPVETVVEAVKERLREIAQPDHVTLYGPGEPTLHGQVGEIIAGIKKVSKGPVVLLTNGSLLWRDEVRKAVLAADLIIPSLDAGGPDTFHVVNRPAGDVTFERMVEGLAALRRDFRGPLWLEVFLVDGLTTGEDEIRRIGQQVERIRPDRVQLNTVDRPPAEPCVRAVPRRRMTEIAERLGPSCEVISRD